MERNGGNEYTRSTSDYEPNFIIKDLVENESTEELVEDESTEELKSWSTIDGPRQSTVRKADVSRPTFENPSYDDGSPRNRVGSYRDPRDNFRSSGTGSASWHSGSSHPGVSHEGSAGTGTAGAGSYAGTGATGPGTYRSPGAGATGQRTAGAGSYTGTGATGPGTYRSPGAGATGQRTAGAGSYAGTGAKKKSRPVTMSRKMLSFIIIGCLLLSSLFGFGGALIGYNMMDNYQKETAQTNTAGTTSAAKTETAGYTLESATGSNMSVKQITAAAKSSVVEIRTEGVVSDSWMQEYVTEGAGSGVIISEDGYVMTNNHVISGAKKITVTTSDEKEYEASLVGADENNDVAILKIDATGLNAAKYGNSDELEVGDLAVAIGNPLGELGGTVTAGIISATDRALSIDGKTLHLLQTDSSINPGNSGGGLFNDSGQLIGLVVAKSAGSDVEGLGFAIPINTAANVAQQLMDKGYVSGQPSTGMTYQEGSSGGSAFGSFESIFGGTSSSQVYIYSVNGENAKKAGFQPGDVVLAVDDEEITSFNDLSSIITSHKVGDEVTFTIQRDGGEKKISLKLEEKKVSNSSGSSGEEGNSEPKSGDGEGNSTPEEGGGFSPIPEDEGGSLFDYFFGW